VSYKYNKKIIFLLLSIISLSLIGVMVNGRVSVNSAEIYYGMSLKSAAYFILLTLPCFQIHNNFIIKLLNLNITDKRLEHLNKIITYIFIFFISFFLLNQFFNLIACFFTKISLTLSYRVDIITNINFILISWILFVLLLIPPLLEKSTLQYKKIVFIVNKSKELFEFVLLFNSFIFALACLHGEPVFTRNLHIQALGLTSALSFFLFAITIICLDRRSYIHQLFSENSQSGYLLRVILPLVILPLIIFSILISGLFNNDALRQNENFNIAIISSLWVTLMAFVIASLTVHIFRKLSKRQDNIILTLRGEKIAFNSVENSVEEQNLQRYKKIVSCSSDMQALVSAEYNYLMANKAYLTKYNLTLEQLIGLTPSNIMGDVFFKTTIKPLTEECMQKNKVVHKAMWLTLSSEPQYLSVTYFPYVNDKNSIVEGFVLNVRDITAQEKEREQTQKKIELLQSIIEASEYHIYVKNNKAEYILANGAYLRYVNKKNEDVIGITDNEIDIAPFKKIKDGDGITKQSRENNKSNDKAAHTYIDKFNNYYDIQESPLLNAQKNNLGTLTIAQNITEQYKRLNDIKIQQQNTLNNAIKMSNIGKQSSGISHDFNNLLGVVLGYCQLLKDELKDDPTHLNYIEQIITAGNRGTLLARKLLTHAKPSCDKLEYVCINQLILDAKDIITKSITPSINLKTILANELWPVYIDKNAFDDMLLNLCLNAKHAMREATIKFFPEIIIRTTNINFSTKEADLLKIKPGGYICLTVEDNGVGMSDETMLQLFQPFFNSKNTNGTGLGLSQAYDFVTKSNSSITVNSTLNSGTVFSIYFPQCSIKAVDETKATKKIMTENLVVNSNKSNDFLTNTVKHKTILIVDDEEALRNLATEILADEGYRIVNAEGGIEALAVLEKYDVDLLLTDIVMPKMNGYQLVEKVSKLYPKIKIIFVSGFQNIENNKKNNEFVTLYPLIDKPYAPKYLVKQVNESLNEDLTQVNHNKLVFNEDMLIDNHGVIDKDHQFLFNLLEQCQELNSESKEFEDELHHIVEQLGTYTNEHFKREEMLMRNCNYPFTENHTTIHNIMIKELHKVISTKTAVEIKTWLNEFLYSWLIDHIMVMDKAIKPYIEQSFTSNTSE